MDYDRNKLLNIYDSIEEKRRARDSHIDIVTKFDQEIKNDILEYRIESVKRVLNHINTLDLEYTTSASLENLIVHCLNKLNGNIDGIELELGGEDEN